MNARAPVLLAVLPRDCHVIVNHLTAEWPLIGLFIRKSGYIVVDRETRASRVRCGRAMVDLLEQGHSLVLFPEGRMADEDMLPFQTGAFHTAGLTQCLVIPVAINGTRQVWPNGSRVFHRHPIKVGILPAVTAQTPDAVERLRDDTRLAIEDALALM